MLTDLRAALGFLTRLPVGFVALDARRLARASVWFPAVGLVVGGLAAGVHEAARQAGVEHSAAVLLAVAATMFLTGGFHEDGLADVADGFGAHVTREGRLEIMRDSRVGTFGALAVAFCVVAPVVFLAPVDGGDFAAAAVCGHVLGRWSALPQTWVVGPAEPASKAALLQVGTVHTLAATALAIAITVAVAGPTSAAIGAATAVVVTTAGALTARGVIGGVTGDTLGAVNKLVELSVYLALATHLS